MLILDRPRHQELIADVRAAGARIRLISDGDVAGVIATAGPDSGIDIYLGIGGAPEGVLAAAALRCDRRPDPGAAACSATTTSARRAARMGITDLDRMYELHDLAAGDVMFAATGVTDGTMLSGVRRFRGGVVTHSIVMRSKTGTVRVIEAEHYLQRKTCGRAALRAPEPGAWRDAAGTLFVDRSVSGRRWRCGETTRRPRWRSASAWTCRRSSAASWRRAASTADAAPAFLEPRLRDTLPDPVASSGSGPSRSSGWRRRSPPASGSGSSATTTSTARPRRRCCAAICARLGAALRIDIPGPAARGLRPEPAGASSGSPRRLPAGGHGRLRHHRLRRAAHRRRARRSR